jgi:uncharacterized protein YjbJ (UPF0337 family)
MAGTTDKMKGKAKEVAGAATGDKSLENEGKLDQAKGSVKKAVENLKEKAKEAMGGAADEARREAEKVEQRTDPEQDDG